MADYHKSLDFLFRTRLDASARAAQRNLPSEAYKAGLAERGDLERAEGTRAFDRSYFVRTEGPGLFDIYDGTAEWAKQLRQSASPRAPFSDLYFINHLSAYAYTLGYRVVPGLRWVAQQATERAQDCREAVAAFEDEINELVRDADGLHRLALRRKEKAFLKMLDDGTHEPFIERIRLLCARVGAQLNMDPGCCKVLGLPDDWFDRMVGTPSTK